MSRHPQRATVAARTACRSAAAGEAGRSRAPARGRVARGTRATRGETGSTGAGGCWTAPGSERRCSPAIRPGPACPAARRAAACPGPGRVPSRCTCSLRSTTCSLRHPCRCRSPLTSKPRCERCSNEHLADSGFRLHDGGHGGWLCRVSVRPATSRRWSRRRPWRRNLRECLPGGRDAVRVRALVNELQMLLHEHPVNERRAARGLPAVNSVWLWGAGDTAEPLGSAAGMADHRRRLAGRPVAPAPAGRRIARRTGRALPGESSARPARSPWQQGSAPPTISRSWTRRCSRPCERRSRPADLAPR